MSLVTRALRRRFLETLDRLPAGRLHLTTPEGTRHVLGAGGAEAEMVLRDWAVLPALAARGDVALGETYVAGLWQTPALEPVLRLALQNLDHLAGWAEPRPVQALGMRLADRLTSPVRLRQAAANIRAHYDVGNEFFHLWLDPGMTYSSALFAEGCDDLGAAQARKNARILSRLGPGERILEIGCGWGGFAEAAAERGRHVTGLTLSPAQKGYADARLDGRAEIRLQDYRQAGGRYDNIVSVEMIEAVGEAGWPGYFATLKARLAEGGRAVVQAITVPDAEFSVYRRRSDYIRRHVFPGGLLPAPAILTREAARAGLEVRGTLAFGQDYARTCRHWAARMAAAAPRIRALGFDDAFLRSWQFYLHGCAATFSTGRTDVMQVEFAHAGEGAALARAA